MEVERDMCGWLYRCVYYCSPPCSLDESIQDPLVFSLLEVMSLLATANMVPTDAWEFILCGLVTIVQVSMTYGLCVE